MERDGDRGAEGMGDEASWILRASFSWSDLVSSSSSLGVSGRM